MAAQNFGPLSTLPAGLVAAIQQNYLERAFIDPLLNVLGYRNLSKKETFPAKIGDTITKTKIGLMIPNIIPLNPSTNTNLDNGLTTNQYSLEQYSLAIYQYPQVAPDINLLDDQTSISEFFMRNAMDLGVAQATALDRIARNSLFNAYMSGNTAVTATLGSPGTTIHVDDTRGFQTVIVNGVVTPVSSGNMLPVYVNGVLYQLQTYANDGTNVSTAISTGGTSGTLTFSTNVTTTDGTAGHSVISAYAPYIARPNGRATTSAIQSTDLLNMTTILAAVAYLKNNAVPKIDGAYNLYLNSTSMNELFQDPEFQILNRGVSVRDPTYVNAWVNSQFLDVRYVETTETFVQSAGLVNGSYTVAQQIQRPLLAGRDTLVEGIFNPGMESIRNMANTGVGRMDDPRTPVNILGEKFTKEGFYFYIRPPLDRLAQIVSQTSNYVGGFVVPTDVTTTSSIIPTASNANYKRAVVFETA